MSENFAEDDELKRLSESLGLDRKDSPTSVFLSRRGAQLKTWNLPPEPIDLDLTPEVEISVSEMHEDGEAFILKADFNQAQLYESPKNGSKLLQNYFGICQVKPFAKAHADTVVALDAIKLEMPNFEHVIDDIKTLVAAQCALDLPLKLLPILLLGDPGIGKTKFMQKLANAMQVQTMFINLGGAGDVMKLKGSAQNWGNSKPGELTQQLANSRHINPLILFDEIDKANKHSSAGEAHSLLLTLLEPTTAKLWEDDYIGKRINMSRVSCVFTANDINELPDYLVSRLSVYHVKAPQQGQKRAIVQSMIKEINDKFFNEFIKHVDDDAVDEIIKYESLRECWRAAFYALARAAADVNPFLESKYVEKTKVAPKRQGIGFTPGL